MRDQKIRDQRIRGQRIRGSWPRGAPLDTNHFGEGPSFGNKTIYGYEQRIIYTYVDKSIWHICIDY